MCAPKIGRQLFCKLRWPIYPIKLIQLVRECEALKALKPLLPLFRRKGGKRFQLTVDRFPLCWKLEIILDDFAEKAWHKAQGEKAQRIQVLDYKLPRLRRITGERLRI
jgi:hypothetical protein